MFQNLHSKILSIAVMAIALTPIGAKAQTPAPPSVPSGLQVPEGHVPFLKGYAYGTQNYVCLPGSTGLAWKFQGPQATVFIKFRWFNTEVMQQVATHFLSLNPDEDPTVARPVWQSSIDTSAVWAKKIEESSDAPYVAPGAIPWLLLQRAGKQTGPTGGSSLAQTSYIQRVNTSGGTISTTACTEAGAIQFVPYTAEYYFYRPQN